MENSVRLAKTAAEVWRSLNGIFCIYKPYGVSVKHCQNVLRDKIAADLNRMPQPEMGTIVDVRRIPVGQSLELEFGERVVKTIQDKDGLVQVIEKPNYADNPLVIGPRFQPHDIKLTCASYLGMDTSGVLVCGINKGILSCQKIRHSRWLRSYVVSGKFGLTTDNYFHTGKITAKSTYRTIKRSMVDRLLSSLQASHQQLSFEAAGLPSNSQTAYEIASTGLIRPAENSETVLYALKCTHFDLPNFDLEIHSINEQEEYLKTFIHDLGFKLHSFAVCTKLRCTKFGPFTVEDTLLSKHWDAQNIIDNITANSKKLKDIDLNVRKLHVANY